MEEDNSKLMMEDLSKETVSSQNYYNEYHSHRIQDLDVVHNRLRHQNNTDGLIFLAGDSSLDNKYWFRDTAPAVNGYEEFLQPPKSKRDVAYWMNKQLTDMKKINENNSNMAVLNCAIEESTIGSRARGNLLPQDSFIKDNITSEDVLVISLGGNDIALRPSVCTICNILSLICCTTTGCIKAYSSCGGTALPCDDPCCGCCCGCLSDLCACPPGMGYFIHLFRTRIEAVLRNMTAHRKPRAIVVCMIYFLDETPGNGWADGVLAALSYNTDPEKLQTIIRRIFTLATQQISIQGTEIIPVALFDALDGKDTRDYCQRVEPSGGSGGRKMATLLLKAIRGTTATTITEEYDNNNHNGDDGKPGGPHDKHKNEKISEQSMQR